MAFLEALWNTTIELAPWLFLGALISTLIHRFLPPGLIAKSLRGYLGIVKAVLLGVPLPLCSCGVIPAGIGLKKEGASDGSTTAFLISTPQTGVDSILVSAAFLGWPFAVFKVVTAAVTGIVGGGLVERFGNDRIPLDGETIQKRKDQSWKNSIEHGIQLLRSIWRWLVFGIILSAALQTLLPPEMFSEWLTGPVAFITALFISIPLYICATASVPIAAAMVASGFPVGAALVFLMAGPATNVATIGVIYKSLGKRNTVFYLGTVIVFSVVLGLLFDSILTNAASSHLGHHEHMQWWNHLFAGGLCLFFLYFAWEELQSVLPSTVPQSQEMIFSVEGMNCNSCVNKLTRELSSLDNVEKVQISLKPGKASIYGTIAKEDVLKKIQYAGFQGQAISE